ncbi:unnamed protein product, partial [Didymodactylos carnosus]
MSTSALFTSTEENLLLTDISVTPYTNEPLFIETLDNSKRRSVFEVNLVCGDTDIFEQTLRLQNDTAVPCMEQYSIRGTTYTVGASYYDLDKIAENVVSASHRLSGEEVAIKKLELNVSNSELDELKFWKNSYKEMKILNTLNHDNIIKLRDIILPDNRNEIYLVQDLMADDLSKIKHKLTIDNIKHYMYKILKGIKY